MELLVVIAMLIVLDISAFRFGVDSRVLDERDRRGWW